MWCNNIMCQADMMAAGKFAPIPSPTGMVFVQWTYIQTTYVHSLMDTSAQFQPTAAKR